LGIATGQASSALQRVPVDRALTDVLGNSVAMPFGIE
jgi:hypothetical protein